MAHPAQARGGWALTLLFLTTLSLPALAAAELEGRARISAGGGVDTNARRDYDGAGAVADGLLSVQGAVEGRATFDSSQLLGSYDIGARRFFVYASEDVVVQMATAEGSFAVGRTMGFGLQGRGRDRRGGERDYTDLAASLFMDFVPDARLDLRAYAGAHRFIYWPVFSYSFAAREAGASVRYRFSRQHAVNAFGELGLRTYNATARLAPDPDAEPPPPDEPPLPPRTREDTAFVIGAGYSYRGPFTFSAVWSYADQSSNSFGETTRRHRLTLSSAFRLPWRLFLLAQLNLQLATYPDGVFLSPEVILEEDAENHNALSLKLARPISGHFDVEVRYAVFQNRLADNGLYYFRQLAYAGLTWRY